MSTSDIDYDKKFQEMQMYLPFLDTLIHKLEDNNEKSKGIQLAKIKSLKSLLCDSEKRMKIENLLRCEQVLLKLKDKTTMKNIFTENEIKANNEKETEVTHNEFKTKSNENNIKNFYKETSEEELIRENEKNSNSNKSVNIELEICRNKLKEVIKLDDKKDDVAILTKPFEKEIQIVTEAYLSNKGNLDCLSDVLSLSVTNKLTEVISKKKIDTVDDSLDTGLSNSIIKLEKSNRSEDSNSVEKLSITSLKDESSFTEKNDNSHCVEKASNEKVVSFIEKISKDKDVDSTSIDSSSNISTILEQNEIDLIYGSLSPDRKECDVKNMKLSDSTTRQLVDGKSHLSSNNTCRYSSDHNRQRPSPQSGKYIRSPDGKSRYSSPSGYRRSSPGGHRRSPNQYRRSPEGRRWRSSINSGRRLTSADRSSDRSYKKNRSHSPCKDKYHTYEKRDKKYLEKKDDKQMSRSKSRESRSPRKFKIHSSHDDDSNQKKNELQLTKEKLNTQQEKKDVDDETLMYHEKNTLSNLKKIRKKLIKQLEIDQKINNLWKAVNEKISPGDGDVKNVSNESDANETSCIKGEDVIAKDKQTPEAKNVVTIEEKTSEFNINESVCNNEQNVMSDDFIKQYVKDAVQMKKYVIDSTESPFELEDSSTSSTSNKTGEISSGSKQDSYYFRNTDGNLRSKFEQDVLDALRSEIADTTVLENTVPKRILLTKVDDSKKNSESDVEKKTRRISLEKYKEKINGPCNKKIETKYIDPLEILNRVLTPKELERFNPIIDSTIEDSILDHETNPNDDELDVLKSSESTTKESFGPESPDSINDVLYSNLRSPDDTCQDMVIVESDCDDDEAQKTCFKNSPTCNVPLNTCSSQTTYPVNNELIESLIKNNRINNVLQTMITNNTLDFVNTSTTNQINQGYINQNNMIIQRHTVESNKPIDELKTYNSDLLACDSYNARKQNMTPAFNKSNVLENIDRKCNLQYGKNFSSDYENINQFDVKQNEMEMRESELNTNAKPKKGYLLPFPKTPLIEENPILISSNPVKLLPLQDPRLKRRDVHTYNVLNSHSLNLSYPQNNTAKINISTNDPRIKHISEKSNPKPFNEKSRDRSMSKIQFKKWKKLQKKLKEQKNKNSQTKQNTSTSSSTISNKKSEDNYRSSNTKKNSGIESSNVIRKDVVILDETDTFVVYDELIYESTPSKKENDQSTRIDNNDITDSSNTSDKSSSPKELVDNADKSIFSDETISSVSVNEKKCEILEEANIVKRELLNISDEIADKKEETSENQQRVISPIIALERSVESKIENQHDLVENNSLQSIKTVENKHIDKLINYKIEIDDEAHEENIDIKIESVHKGENVEETLIEGLNSSCSNNKCLEKLNTSADSNTSVRKDERVDENMSHTQSIHDDTVSNLLTVLNDKQKMLEMLSLLSQKDVISQKVIKKLELLAEMDSDDDENQNNTEKIKNNTSDNKNVSTEKCIETDIPKNITENTAIKTSEDIKKANELTLDAPKNYNEKKPKQKSKSKPRASEIEVLRESLPEVFINKGGLNPGAIRMCRLLKVLTKEEEKSMPEAIPKRSTRQTAKKENNVKKNESSNSPKTMSKEVSEEVKLPKLENLISKEPFVILEKTNTSIIQQSDKHPIEISSIKLNSTDITPKETCSTAKLQTNSNNSKKTAYYNKPCPKSKKKYLVEEDLSTSAENDSFSTTEMNLSSTTENLDDFNEGSSHDETFNVVGMKLVDVEKIGVSPKKNIKKKKTPKWQTGVFKRAYCKKTKSAKNDSKNTDIVDFCDKLYYYSPNIKEYKCKYCNYSTDKTIIKHYKEKHQGSEVLISRISPEEAEKAINEIPVKSTSSIARVEKYRYRCRFCATSINTAWNFFNHITHNHTGESTADKTSLYITSPTLTDPDRKGNVIFPVLKGYLCSICNFTQFYKKNIEKHIKLRHENLECNIYEINLSNLSIPSTDAVISKQSSDTNEDNISTSIVKEENEKVKEKLTNVTTETEFSSSHENTVDNNSENIAGTPNLQNIKIELNDPEDGVFSVSANTSIFSNEFDITDINSLKELDIKEEPNEKNDDLNETIDKINIKDEPLQIQDQDVHIDMNDVTEMADIEERLMSKDVRHFTIGKIKATVSENRIKYECNVNNCILVFDSLLMIENHMNDQHGNEKWDGFCSYCNQTFNINKCNEALKHLYMYHLCDVEEMHKEKPLPRINVRPMSHLLAEKNNVHSDQLFSPRIESVVSLRSLSTNSISNNNYDLSDVNITQIQGIKMNNSNRDLFTCTAKNCCFSTNKPDTFMEHLCQHAKLSNSFDCDWRQCIYCKIKYNEDISLVSHIFKVHGGSSYVCGVCYFRSASYILAFIHSLKMHNAVPNNQRVEFASTQSDSDDPEQTYILPKITCLPVYVCTFSVKSKNEMKECGQQFRSPDLFMRHLIEMDHNKPMCCQYCRSTKMEPSLILWHLHKIHHYNLYRCSYCIFGTDTQKIILEHLLDNHSNRRAMYYFCNSVLKSESINKPSIDTVMMVNLDRNIKKHLTVVRDMFASTDDNCENLVSSENENHPESSQTNVKDHDNEVINLDDDDVEETLISSVENNVSVTDANANEKLNSCDSVNSHSNEKEESSAIRGLFGSKLYKCGSDNCKASFMTYREFSTHLCKCNIKNKVKCFHCKLEFHRPKWLLFHISVHGETRYECEICKYRTNIRLKCVNHVKNEHKISSVECVPVIPGKNSHCTDKFYVRELVCEKKSEVDDVEVLNKDRHVKENIKNDAKQVKYGPENISDLPHLPILSENIYCSVCSFSTKVTSNMQRHLQLHSSETYVPAVAPVNPVPHLQTNEMHFDKMTNLALSSNIDRLQVQRNTSFPKTLIPKYVDLKERFVCGSEVCRYTSVSEKMLEIHWTTLHMDETSYFCAHCLKTMSIVKYSDIGDHLRLHGKTLFGCNTCQLMHFSLAEINVHNINKHNGLSKIISLRYNKNNNDNNKLWRCKLCPTFMETKNKIIYHCINFHSGQYRCTLCDFPATSTYVVNNHFKDAHPKSNIVKCMTIYFNVKEKNTLAVGGTEDRKRTSSDLSDTDEGQPEVVSNKKIKATESGNNLSPLQTKTLNEAHVGQPAHDKFCCPFCISFTTKSKSDFKTHLYKELNYKLWQCETCPYATYTLENISEHCKKHKKESFKKNYINLKIENWVKLCIDKQSMKILENTTLSNEKTSNETVLLDDDSDDCSNGKLVICESEKNNCVIDIKLKSSKKQKSSQKVVEKSEMNKNKKKNCETTIVEKHKTNTDIVKYSKCSFCPYINMKSLNLSWHMKRHWKIKPLKCNYCNFQFISRKEGIMHHAKHHKNLPICLIDIQLPNEPEYISLQRKPGSVRCSLCSNTFKHMLDLDRHGETHHPNLDIDVVLGKDNQVFKCAICYLLFLSFASIESHFKISHVGFELRYEMYYANLGEQDTVVVDKSIVETSMFKCIYCNSTYDNFEDLYDHHKKTYKKDVLGIMPLTLARITDTGEIKKNPSFFKNSFECIISYCNYTTNTIKSLKSHVRSHYYICKCIFCKKSFQFGLNYIKHCRSEHNDEKMVRLPKSSRQLEVLDRVNQIDKFLNVLKDEQRNESITCESTVKTSKKQIKKKSPTKPSGSSFHKKIKLEVVQNTAQAFNDEFEFKLSSDDDEDAIDDNNDDVVIVDS